MTKADRARAAKAADPTLSAYRIGKMLNMDPHDVRRALAAGGPRWPKRDKEAREAKAS